MRPPALAVAPILAAFLLAGTSARADDDSELEDALAAFADAEKALTTSAPCDTMCKALQSMIRAADRICELARDGSATDQKRCTDAKTKVAEATARVRSSCPNCDPSPPYAPSTAPTPKPMAPKTEANAPPVDAGAMPAPARAAEEAMLAGVSQRAMTTLSLDVIPLFAPPWVVQARLERSIARRFSFALVGAYGALPKNGPEGSGRTSVFGIGGELRGYVFGTFDRFGVFVGAELMYRSGSNLAYREYLDARAFPVGLTTGALLGTKVVFGGGLTIEARIGPAVVLDDHRADGPRDKVVPTGGIALGWTF